MSNLELIELFSLLTEYENRLRYNQFLTIFPDQGPLRRSLYVKHIKFLEAGASFRERAIIAGNRIGKSYVAAFEVALHATGLYDLVPWWKGKTFSNATRIWCASDTNEKTAEIAQEILLGPLSDLGSGLIPRDRIVDTVSKPGVTGALKSVDILHTSGRLSKIWFKSYQEGREGFQGTARDVIWLDEECPSDIYTESLLRTMTTEGLILLTFTPLKGLTETIQRFLPDGKLPDGNCVPGMSRWVTEISWEDNPPHLNEKDKKEMMNAMLPHERDARMHGIPAIGAGKVFQIPESEIVCDSFEIPVNWPRSFGMDIGWIKTAAAWFAYDKSRDMWYLYDEYYTGMQQFETHALAIKKRGAWIPGVIDPSAKRSNDEGKKAFQEYRKHGLNIRLADNTIDAGILKLTELLATGKLKIFKTCQSFLKEYRLYNRNEQGTIDPKQEDHLMDAARYWVNSGLKIACTKPDIDPLNDWRRPGLFGNNSNHSFTERSSITGC